MVVAHPFGVTTGPNTTTRILLSSSSSFPAPLLPRLALETLLATALDAVARPRQLREAMAASSASAFMAATFSSPASFAASPTTTSPPTTTGPNTTTRILLSSSSSFPTPLLPRPALETLLATALDAAASPRQLREAHGCILRLSLHGSNFLVTRLLRRLANHCIPTQPYPLLVFAQVPFPNSFLWTARIHGAALLLHFASSAVTHPICLYVAMHHRWPPTPPLSFTFLALLKACAAVRSLAMGTQVRF